MSAEPAPVDLREVRCRGRATPDDDECGRLLARMEAGALRDGCLLEFKCGKCNRTLTMIGGCDEEPSEAKRPR